MNRLWNLFLWIDDAFSRTPDPVLAQHRSLQRHCLLSAVATVLALAGEYFVSSLAPVESPYHLMLQAISEPLSWLCLVISAVGLLWLVWAIYALWQFERDFN